MAFSKLKNRFLIVFCLFVVILPFYFITFTYATEELDYNLTTINDVCISSNGSLISANGYVSYFLELEDGINYTLDFSEVPTDAIRLGYCNSTDVGTEIYNYTLSTSKPVLFINSNDYDYVYFCFGNVNLDYMQNFHITATTANGMSTSVESLVNNVGIQQFWSTFTDAIPMISTCAIFVFGFVIVAYLYLKLSKGKAGF